MYRRRSPGNESPNLSQEELETTAATAGNRLSARNRRRMRLIPACCPGCRLPLPVRNTLLPLHEKDGNIRIAVAGPAGLLALDELRLLFGKPVEAVLVPPAVLTDAINHVYAGVSGTAREVLQELEGEDLSTIATEFSDPKDLLDLTDEAPVIRLLNSILFEAVKERASDIHIEPYERDLLVRFRIDGILYKKLSPPRSSRKP